MKTTLLLLALCGLAAAQTTTIPNTNRYAYAANAGWIDFHADVNNGVRVADTALSGYAYATNFGWIHFGDGSPTNGHTYSTTSATDYGVNVSPTGLLTGYAYAANIGWITFEQTHGQPKLDLRTGKFTGYAYSGNIGWIALDTALSDLATDTISRPDTDSDGIADSWEMLNWSNLTTATATSDRDGDGSSDRSEYNAGTNPTNNASNLRIISHTYPSASQANITFTSELTRNYRIEHDTDLQAPWTNSTLGTFAPTGAITTGALTGLSTAPRRFFRAVAVPLPTD
jgi:hypothetical protein